MFFLVYVLFLSMSFLWGDNREYIIEFIFFVLLSLVKMFFVLTYKLITYNFNPLLITIITHSCQTSYWFQNNLKDFRRVFCERDWIAQVSADHLKLCGLPGFR